MRDLKEDTRRALEAISKLGYDPEEVEFVAPLLLGGIFFPDYDRSGMYTVFLNAPFRYKGKEYNARINTQLLRSSDLPWEFKVEERVYV